MKKFRELDHDYGTAKAKQMKQKKEKSGHWQADPEWPDDENERFYWCFNTAELEKATELTEGMKATAGKDMETDEAEALLGEG